MPLATYTIRRLARYAHPGTTGTDGGGQFYLPQEAVVKRSERRLGKAKSARGCSYKQTKEAEFTRQ